MYKIRSDQCFKCKSRKCYHKIATESGDFNELACQDHFLDLEKHADAVLGSKTRIHISGTTRKSRRRD